VAIYIGTNVDGFRCTRLPAQDSRRRPTAEDLGEETLVAWEWDIIDEAKRTAVSPMEGRRSTITAWILRVFPPGSASGSNEHLGTVVNRTRPCVAATQAQIAYVTSDSGLETMINGVTTVATYHDRTTRRNDAGSTEDSRIELLADPKPFATGSDVGHFQHSVTW